VAGQTGAAASQLPVAGCQLPVGRHFRLGCRG
jgi:hypothetical protein